MDTFAYIILTLVWVAPLPVFRLSSRCPPGHKRFWVLALALSSWAGLAGYVWVHYWMPELRKGPPSAWRTATDSGSR